MLHSLCCLIIHFNKELSFLSMFIPSRHSGGLLAQCSISHQESFHLFPHLKRTRGPHLQMLHRWQISCKKAVSFHTPVPVNCVMEWSWRLTRSLFWWILSFLLHSLDRRVTQVSSCVLWSQIIKPDVLGAAGECAFFLSNFLRLAMKPYCLPPSCNGSCTETYLQGDFSSSAQFFVCVGVFAFLYCTATLIVYLGYRSVYLQTSRGPVIVSTRFVEQWACGCYRRKVCCMVTRRPVLLASSWSGFNGWWV